MKRILQAMDGVASKPVAGADSMARFLRVVKEADLNQPTAPVPPTAPTATAEEPMQSPEQIKYNQLRAQWDGYQAMTSDPGGNTFVSKDPVHDAKLQTIPAELARMAAALKAKGIDAEADYDAISGPKSAPVDLNQMYKDDEPAAAPAPVSEGLSKFLSIVRKNDVGILNEGTNPHKVSLPVQMAMQHYQKQSDTPARPVGRTSTFGKYFHKVEAEVNEAVAEEQAQKRQLINQYASVIAERVLMKEAANPAQQAAIAISKKKERQADESLKTDNPCWKGYKPVGTKKKGGRTVPNCVPTNENEVPGTHSLGFKPGPGSPGIQSAVAEAPIAMDPSEPNNPTIHGHQKANAMTLKGRIMSARAQLKELAQLAERDDLLAWEEICKKSKGGMFMGLEQNLEQIRHGLEQLAAKRRKGGVASRGIDKNIGEAVTPTIKPAKPKAIKPKAKTSTCRAGQTQTGVQTKDGKTVPKCSVVKKGF